MDFSKYTDEELMDIIEKAKAELARRREGKWIHFKTDGCFTPKFGPAYVAKLYLSGDEVEREFVPSNGKEWCKKSKSYKEDWDVEIFENDVLETRLTTGRKVDKREWYYVKEGELIPLMDLDEAKQFLKNLK
ncbi:hypothetical protein NAMH_0045 [Nautilia profundicola AmH]|uniref:Uncharacterized protein n=1 Tax=Nautilia profundicola (strain ATCC BAA-1463 / DSM 18972 / AmH) TaxID=598659 RepID=B9L779_NAUPA|nr:hypothetical protein [Nautilia profundicola]ACM93499.1 hypothetical protein NAMH_0045 [Nautilia profundicola AmH]